MERIKNLKSPAVWYCYMDGSEAVFLDRKDREIKRFNSYSEAIDFAEKNLHLIDN
jgi:hypothetical protein